MLTPKTIGLYPLLHHPHMKLPGLTRIIIPLLNVPLHVQNKPPGPWLLGLAPLLTILLQLFPNTILPILAPQKDLVTLIWLKLSTASALLPMKEPHHMPDLPGTPSHNRRLTLQPSAIIWPTQILRWP